MADKKKLTVAVIGASTDPSKYGNKSVRAHLQAGYEVYPVNPKEPTVEGLTAYKSVLDVPVELDRITIYLPPPVGLKVLPDIARKGAKEIFFNPGSESREIFEKAESLGIKPLFACSMVNIGYDPEGM